MEVSCGSHQICAFLYDFTAVCEFLVRLSIQPVLGLPACPSGGHIGQLNPCKQVSKEGI
jgi:hypothetical protein